MFKQSIVDGAAACLLGALTAAAAMAAPQQPLQEAPGPLSYKVTFEFKGKANGGTPSQLTWGGDGYFYGTTSAGGSLACEGGCGTLFRIDNGGNHEVLHSFTGGYGGSTPMGGVSRAKDGAFYGTTYNGYNQYGGAGTLYRYKNGVHEVLHYFNALSQAGERPMVPPVPGADGAFYGTTSARGTPTDGSTCEYPGCGTIYRLSVSGSVSKLYGFNQGDINRDGGSMHRLALGSDGNLYGITRHGGAAERGTIFRWTPGVGYDIVHEFNAPGGYVPWSELTLGSDGHLYGTTWYGGTSGVGTVYRLNVLGAVATLYNFGREELSEPRGSVVRADDGTLFGTTTLGGGAAACTRGCGGVYAIKDGVLKTIHAFQGVAPDGLSPRTGLVLRGDRSLYGTTAVGGSKGAGIVYRIKGLYALED